MAAVKPGLQLHCLHAQVGHHLPEKVPLPIVLVIAFALGVLVTYAEPAIAAIRPLAALVDPQSAPYLYYVLNQQQEITVSAWIQGRSVHYPCAPQALSSWGSEPSMWPQQVVQHGQPKQGSLIKLLPQQSSVSGVLLCARQVLSIGLGVGLAAVLGMLKFMYNLPLKALIAGSLLPTIAAACWMQW